MPEDPQHTLFAEWLEGHGAAVMKVARAYTLTDDDHQDLAQEILLQAWRSLPRFEGQANPATWFYRVALNTAMNWRRKDRPRREKQRPLIEVHEPVAGGDDGRASAERRETVQRLYAAIHALPKGDAALVLLHLEGLTYAEMADVLGVSENHVGVKLHRAKRRLANQMQGPDPTQEGSS